MSEIPDASPGDGMTVPEGIESLSVPSSIPPGLFDEAASTPGPRRSPAKPSSLPASAVAKPLSLPGVRAPSPPSVPSTRVAKPPSIRRMTPPFVRSATPEGPAALVASELPSPRQAYPSSFPSCEKTLVLDVVALEPPTPEPPPSSVGAVVTAVGHEAAEGGPRDALSPAPVKTTAPSFPDTSELAAVGLPKPRPRAWWAAGGVMIAGAVAAISFAGGFARTAPGHDDTRRSAGTIAPAGATPPRAAAPSVETAAAPTEVAAPARPATGIVSTSAATPGRRFFIDQRMLGQTPEPAVVKCGLHRVRIGSAGKTMTVDVPCGGEVSVSDR